MLDNVCSHMQLTPNQQWVRSLLLVNEKLWLWLILALVFWYHDTQIIHYKDCPWQDNYNTISIPIIKGFLAQIKISKGAHEIQWIMKHNLTLRLWMILIQLIDTLKQLIINCLNLIQGITIEWFDFKIIMIKDFLNK